MQEQALVPRFILSKGNALSTNIIAVISGIILLSLLAQISIPLPFTPVPITGQTFGVAFIALTWGRKRSVAILMSYLSLGAMGLPIFASGQSGFGGATSGYLIGMLIGSYIMGFLSDQGWCNTFIKSLAAAYLGSFCVFISGLFILSFFIPHQGLLASGFYPFLPGDSLKNFLAALLVSKTNKLLRDDL